MAGIVFTWLVVVDSSDCPHRRFEADFLICNEMSSDYHTFVCDSNTCPRKMRGV